jgi:hypothetical protein
VIGEATPARIETVRKATAVVERLLKGTKAFQYLGILHEGRVTGMRDGRRDFGQQIEIRCWDSLDARTATPTPLPFKTLVKLAQAILRDVPSTSASPSTSRRSLPRPWRRCRGHCMNVRTSPLQTIGLLAAVMAGIVGCASGRQSGATTDPRPPLQAAGASAAVPNLYEVQRQVDDYILSGRYDHDVAAVVAQARQWVEERAPKAVKPAIVLDIDETSLSNWRAYRVNGWGRVLNGPCDLQQGPCGLRAWQALAQADALEPTLTLARRARELGVAVFFITGRPSNLTEASARNLRERGYEWTGLILEAEGAQFTSAADFKAPERRKLTEQGYTVILSLGDQESDLTGGYAERTFKLPNPVYFLP